MGRVFINVLPKDVGGAAPLHRREIESQRSSPRAKDGRNVDA